MYTQKRYYTEKLLQFLFRVRTKNNDVTHVKTSLYFHHELGLITRIYHSRSISVNNSLNHQQVGKASSFRTPNPFTPVPNRALIRYSANVMKVQTRATKRIHAGG